MRHFNRLVAASFIGLGLMHALPQAGAATLFATSQTTGISDFTITFTDAGAPANGLFDPSELDSFSGVTIASLLYDKLCAVPAITSFTTAGTLLSICTTANNWEFYNSGGGVVSSQVGAGAWTYRLTGVGGQVPEPGTLALLGGGGFLIAALRSRGRRRLGRPE